MLVGSSRFVVSVGFGVILCWILDCFCESVIIESEALGASGYSLVISEEDKSLGDEKSKEELDRQKQPFNYSVLFNESEDLRKLDKNSPIWVSRDRKNVFLGGEVCLREGLLEFFACRKNSKEHESIITLDIPPHLIHAALLVIGAKQGAPAKFDPVFVPPTGDEIEVRVRWRDENNEIRSERAQEWILENESGKIMQASWVFSGGLFGVDPDGKKYYLANVTGEVFGVSNFPGSVLDVPVESPSDYSALYYMPNTKKIPPIGTKVIIILSRKNK